MVVRVLVVQRLPLVSMENNIVYLFEEVVLVLCFAFLLFNFMIFFWVLTVAITQGLDN